MADIARPDRLDETAILDRRRQVAQLYLRRVTQAKIAEQLKVHPSTISDDLIALREEWRQEHRADVAAVIDRELGELDAMENDAALQFNQTKEAAWIIVRLRCKERRAKLLGLDAPTAVNITGVETKAYVCVDVDAV